LEQKENKVNYTETEGWGSIPCSLKHDACFCTILTEFLEYYRKKNQATRLHFLSCKD